MCGLSYASKRTFRYFGIPLYDNCRTGDFHKTDRDKIQREACIFVIGERRETEATKNRETSLCFVSAPLSLMKAAR